jgi:hypothetical protein
MPKAISIQARMWRLTGEQDPDSTIFDTMDKGIHVWFDFSIERGKGAKRWPMIFPHGERG